MVCNMVGRILDDGSDLLYEHVLVVVPWTVSK